MFNSDLAAASLVLGISAVAWTRAIHFSPMGGIFVRFVLGILTLLRLILLLKSRYLREGPCQGRETTVSSCLWAWPWPVNLP